MPSLGADMEDAIVVDWLVKPGDQVSRGDVIAVVETQKGLIEIETFENGVIQQIVVPEGAKAAVGAVLARIGATAAAEGTVAVAPPPPAAAPAQVTPTVVVPTATPATGRLRVSPVARRLAEELGVDLATVHGTGPGGAIQRADVEQAARQPAPPPTPPPAAPRVATAEQRAAMRDAIARAMARSKREIPHYYLGSDVDMKVSLEWLASENARRPVAQRLLYASLLIKATALAVRDVPEMNGHFVDGAFRASEAVHVGVAISLRQGGLVAPAIHHADLLSLDELMAALRDLVMRARGGVLRGSEMTDPTITVTNLGEQGVSTVFGVIYPPQVALVGFGTISERPWAMNGMLGVRPIMSASLSADHRASDGHRGGVFLNAIARWLQTPEKL